MYLNNNEAYKNFVALLNSEIFIDKSMILKILNRRIHTTNRFICITRPRRFGKSEITNLIESYYSKALDTVSIFNALNIGGENGYAEHLNKYNIIKVDFSIKKETSEDYTSYINRIINGISDDLLAAYPEVDFSRCETLSSKFVATRDEFIFIFD